MNVDGWFLRFLMLRISGQESEIWKDERVGWDFHYSCKWLRGYLESFCRCPDHNNYPAMVKVTGAAVAVVLREKRNLCGNWPSASLAKGLKQLHCHIRNIALNHLNVLDLFIATAILSRLTLGVTHGVAQDRRLCIPFSFRNIHCLCLACSCTSSYK